MKEIANVYQRTVKILVLDDGDRSVELHCTRSSGGLARPSFVLSTILRYPERRDTQVEMHLSEQDVRDLQVAVNALLRYSEQQWEAVEVGAA